MNTTQKRTIIGILSAIVLLALVLTVLCGTPLLNKLIGNAEGNAEFVIAECYSGDYYMYYDADGDTPWSYDTDRNCFYANAYDAYAGYGKVTYLTFTTSGNFIANFTADLQESGTYLSVEYDGEEKYSWSGADTDTVSETVSLSVEEGMVLTVTLYPDSDSDSSTASFTVNGYAPEEADYEINETWFDTWSDEVFYYNKNNNIWSGRVCGDWYYTYITMALVNISETGLINFHVNASLDVGAQLVINFCKDDSLTNVYTIFSNTDEYREFDGDITLDAAAIHAMNCDSVVFELTFDADTYDDSSDEYYRLSNVDISDLKPIEKEAEYVIRDSNFQYDIDAGTFNAQLDDYDGSYSFKLTAISSGLITFSLDFSWYNAYMDIFGYTANDVTAYYFGLSYDELDEAFEAGESITDSRSVSMYVSEGVVIDFTFDPHDPYGDYLDTPNGSITITGLRQLNYDGVLETLTEDYWLKSQTESGTNYKVNFSKYNNVKWDNAITLEFNGDKWISFDYFNNTSSYRNKLVITLDGITQVEDTTSKYGATKQPDVQKKKLHAVGNGSHVLVISYHFEVTYTSTSYNLTCEVQNLKILDSLDEYIEFTVTYNEDLGTVLMDGQKVPSGVIQKVAEGFSGHLNFAANESFQSTADPKRTTSAVFYDVTTLAGKRITSLYQGNTSVEFSIVFTDTGIKLGSSSAEGYDIVVNFREVMLPILHVNLNKVVEGEEEQENITLSSGDTVHVPFNKSNQLGFSFDKYVSSLDYIEIAYTITRSDILTGNKTVPSNGGDLDGIVQGFALENITLDTTIKITPVSRKVSDAEQTYSYYGSPVFTINIIIDEPGTAEDIAALKNLKSADSENFTITHDTLNQWYFAPEMSTGDSFVYKAFTGEDTVSQLKFHFPDTGSVSFEIYTWGFLNYTYGDNVELRYSRLLFSFKDRIPTDEAGKCKENFMRGDIINKNINNGILNRLIEGNDAGHSDESDRRTPWYEAKYVTELGDGWLRVQIPVAQAGDMWLAYYCNNELDRNLSCYIRNIGFYSGNANVDFSIKGYDGDESCGKITAKVANKEITSGSTVSMGNQINFSVSFNSGYKFYGWVMNDKLMSTSTTWNYTVSKNNAHIYAVIAPTDTYLVRNEGKFYVTLNEAISDVGIQDTLYIIKNGGHISESCELPEGVSLVLPMNSAEKYYVQAGTTTNHMAWYDTNEAKFKYYTLTIDSGVTLIIKGTFYIGGTLHRGDRSAQAHTSGAYSHLINDGTIEVENKGVLDIYGRITGDGKINVRNGAYMYQPFLVLDYAGGSNTQDLFTNNQVPFRRYAMINVECEFTIYYGAVLMGHSSLYFWSSIHTLEVPFISYEKAPVYSDRKAILILKENSYARMTYEADRVIKNIEGAGECLGYESVGLTHMTLHGGAIANYMEFPLGINTSQVAFSIPYNFDILLESGVFDMNYPYKLMPGAVLTVAESATLNINDDFFIYDGLIQQTMSGGIYPQVSELTGAGYSATAQFIVNGTVNVNNKSDKNTTFLGAVQTTGTKGRLNIAAGVILEGTVIDGGLGTYDCNYAEFPSSARIWDNVNGKLVKLVAGHSYVSQNADCTWTLPGVTVKHEIGTARYTAPHSSSQPHQLETTTLPEVEGMHGGWMIEHKQHDIQWTFRDGDDLPSAENPITTVTRHCTAVGCNSNETRTLIYLPTDFGTVVYTGTAITEAEIKAAISQLLGKDIFGSVKATLQFNSFTNVNDAGYDVTIVLENAYWVDVQAYKASVTRKIKVIPAHLSEENVQLAASQEYTGSQLMPEPTVSYNGKQLQKNVDYSLSFGTNLTVKDTGTVTVKGMGNFEGSVTVTFTITPKNVDDVALQLPAVTYTGKAQTPNITIPGYTKDTDYILDWSDNTNAGNAKVTIKFQGNYSGSVTKTFTINPADSASVTVEFERSGYTYNGQAHNPDVTVKLGDVVLTSPDVTVRITNNINAGAADVTVEFGSNFTGGSRVDHFSIAKAAVTLTVNEQKATYQNKNLDASSRPGVDYTVQGLIAEDNVTVKLSVSNAKNAGSYAITAALEGDPQKVANYQLAVTSYADKFVVGPAQIDRLEVLNATCKYTGSQIDGQVKVYAGTLELSAGDFDIETTNNTNIGTAQVKVTAKGNFKGELTGSFQIEPADVSNALVELLDKAESFVYKKAAYTPAVKVTHNSFTFDAQTDYDVTYDNNTNAGEAHIKVTFKGNFTGDVQISFTISPKPLTVQLREQKVFYNEKAQSAASSSDKYSIDGLEQGDVITLNLTSAPLTNVGSADITATPAAADDVTLHNYSIASEMLTLKNGFKVEALSLEGATVTVSGSYTYNAKQQRPTKSSVSVSVDGIEGEITFDISYGTNITVKEGGSVTVTGTGNFTDSATVTFAINPASVTVRADSKSSPQGEEQELLTASLIEGELYQDGNTVLASVKLHVDGDVKSALSGAKLTIVAAYESDGSEANSNYTVHVENGTYTITDAVFKDMKFESGSVVYDGSAHGLTVSGAPLGAVCTYTYFKGAEQLPGEPIDVGVYTVKVHVVLTSDHEYTTDQEATLRITTKSATIKLDVQTVVYNGSLQQVVTDGNWSWGDEVISADRDSLTVQLSGSGRNVGDYTITAAISGAKADNYNFGESTTLEHGFVITQKDAQLVIKDQSKVYTGSLLSVDTDSSKYTLTGICADDDVTVTLQGNATDVSSTQITAIISGTAASNYKIAVTNGTFNIEPKEASGASVSVNGSFTYSGEEHRPVPNVVLDRVPLINEQDYTLSYNSNVDAGEATVTVSFKGNYSGSTSQTFTIGRRNAKVEVSLYSVEYNGQQQSAAKAQWTFDGNVLEKDKNGLNVVLSGSGTDVGQYDISAEVSGERADNYNFSTEHGTHAFEITPAAVTKVEVLGSYVYSESEQSVQIKLWAGALEVTAVDYDVAYAEGSDRINVGAVSFTVEAHNNFGGKLSSEFTITPLPVSTAILTVANDSVYNGQAQQPAVMVLLGDKALDAQQDFEVSYSDNINAGNSAVAKVTFKGNYSGEQTKTFRIAARAVELKLLDQNVTYNGALQNASSDKQYYELIDVIDGDILNVSVKGSGITVGEYAITAKVSGDKASNYDVNITGALLIIGKATVNVLLSDQNTIYNGQLQSASSDPTLYTVQGTVYNNDVLGIQIVGGGMYAGSYALTLTWDNTNYDVTYNSDASFVIAKATITVSVADKQSVYGDAFEQLTFSYTGLLEKDADSVDLDNYVTLVCSASTERNVGSYSILATLHDTDSLSNYNLQIVNSGIYTVTKRALTVTVNDQNVVYDPEGNYAFDVNGWRITEGRLASGESNSVLNVVLTKPEIANAGSYEITAAYTNSNYEVTIVKGNYNVSKLELPDNDQTVFELYIDGDYFDPDKIYTYSGTALELTAHVYYLLSPETEIGVKVDPSSIAEAGYITVTVTVEDPNYSGERTYTVTVVGEDGLTPRLKEVLESLEALCGDLTIDTLSSTEENFTKLKQAQSLIDSLTEEEKESGAETLAPYTELLQAWNRASELDEGVISTAKAIADAPLKGLLAAVNALLAAVYAALKGGIRK